MAFLLNYNFQIQQQQSKNFHGVYNPGQNNNNNNNNNSNLVNNNNNNNNNNSNQYNNGNNNSNGSNSNFKLYMQPAHRSPPKKYVLSHFDDSFPLETHTITRTSSLKDDDFKYGHRPNFGDQDDQLIFVIDDL